MEIQIKCGFGDLIPSTTSLNLVATGDEEFPVHFAATVNTGMLFSKANINIEFESLENTNPDDLVEQGADTGGTNSAEVGEQIINTVNGFSGYLPLGLI